MCNAIRTSIMMRPYQLLFTFLTLTAACGQSNEEAQFTHTINPDSIQVVENGTLPQVWDGELPVLTMMDEWTLGADPTNEEEQFYFLTPDLLSEGPEQQIGILCLRPLELRVFDRAGQFLWKVGRKGDGPGEFRNPNGLLYQRSVGWIVSERLKKIIFNEQGVYVRTVNLGQHPYAPASRDFHLGSMGRFWYLGIRSRSVGNALGTSYYVVAGDWQESMARVLFSIEQPSIKREEGRVYILEQWPSVLCIDAYERAWIVGDLPYQIEVIPHSGDGRFRIRRNYELRKYDPTYRENFESNWEGYSSEPIMWPRLPDRQPAIQNISKGPDGEMWVFTKAWVDSPMVQVDVFSEEGIYERAFLANVALAGFPFAADHVYRVDKAEDGAPLLVRSRHRTVSP